MIFSIFIRNYKIYQNINYIPISDSTDFSAFVGENGVGKSSVLEALDSYFNGVDWNYNHSVSQKGFSEREPYICPVFLIGKSSIHKRSNIYKFLSIFSSITWQIEPEDFNQANRGMADFFCWHREKTRQRGINDKDYFLFPLGLLKTTATSTSRYLGIFSGIDDYKERIESECSISLDESLDRLYNFLLAHYRYIYIPSDINFEDYTKIEGNTVQALMGRKIEEIVKGFIDESQVRDINGKLDSFMEKVSDDLVDYVYKKHAKRQVRFNLTHLSSKIVEAYFENKVLNLKDETGSETPVYNLSSGEKRRAIIDVARSFLLKTKIRQDQKVIFAIDEPELSLHVASCFQQFNKLKTIAENKIQVLMTTHWYGFMPIISEGSAIYMSSNQKRACIIDLRCFRDEINAIKGHTKGRVPKNLELKGTNDLVQSIISSITASNCKWIVCEGVSDKIYLEHFMKNKDIFILPIGKSMYVKKIFKHLYLALDDNRETILGNVFLLVDTDKKFERDDLKDSISKIRIRRLQNNESTMSSDLRKLSDNDYYPPTEMEDSLNPSVFMITLAKMLAEYSDSDKFNSLNSVSLVYKEAPSGLAFDLNQSQLRELESFFNEPRKKVDFALEYVSLDTDRNIPLWIEEVNRHLSL